MNDFEFDLNWGVDEIPIKPKKEKETPDSNHRRTKECTFFTEKYLFKRAFSESHLIDCLGMEDFKPNHSYNFITAGDVDALSYLKLILRHNKTLNYLLVSTWVISAEDILQLDKWVEGGGN